MGARKGPPFLLQFLRLHDSTACLPQRPSKAKLPRNPAQPRSPRTSPPLLTAVVVRAADVWNGRVGRVKSFQRQQVTLESARQPCPQSASVSWHARFSPPLRQVWELCLRFGTQLDPAGAASAAACCQVGNTGGARIGRGVTGTFPPGIGTGNRRWARRLLDPDSAREQRRQQRHVALLFAEAKRHSGLSDYI